MRGLSSTIRADKLIALLLLTVFLLASLSVGPAFAKSDKTPGSVSDEILLKNSRRHYVQALIEYNDFMAHGKNIRKNIAVTGLLQAAVSDAKHVDPELAGLLEQLCDCFPVGYVFPRDIAGQIASKYNSYNEQFSWGYAMFDPANPTGVPPGDQPV